jgi:hypothetical protein
MPRKIVIPPYSPKLKNPPYPEHVTEQLRERMRKGMVTLGRDELKRIIAMLEILSDRCGAAYQVVGALADYADIYEDPAVVKAMDLLAFPLRRGSFSPFHPKKIQEKNLAEWQRGQPAGKRGAASAAVSRSASRPKKKT